MQVLVQTCVLNSEIGPLLAMWPGANDLMAYTLGFLTSSLENYALEYRITSWFSANTISVWAQGLTDALPSNWYIFHLITSYLFIWWLFTYSLALSLYIPCYRRVFLGLPDVSQLMKGPSLIVFFPLRFASDRKWGKRKLTDLPKVMKPVQRRAKPWCQDHYLPFLSWLLPWWGQLHPGYTQILWDVETKPPERDPLCISGWGAFLPHDR